MIIDRQVFWPAEKGGFRSRGVVGAGLLSEPDCSANEQDARRRTKMKGSSLIECASLVINSRKIHKRCHRQYGCNRSFPGYHNEYGREVSCLVELPSGWRSRLRFCRIHHWDFDGQRPDHRLAALTSPENPLIDRVGSLSL